MSEIIVQYVIARMDLITTLKWPLGAVIAQSCHACTAALHIFSDHADTRTYLSDLDRMHKVVLEVPDEDSLRKLAAQLTDAKIDHKLWIEQPEDVATCIATRPYSKQQVQKHFKHLKLMK